MVDVRSSLLAFKSFQAESLREVHKTQTNDLQQSLRGKKDMVQKEVHRDHLFCGLGLSTARRNHLFKAVMQGNGNLGR